jgi:putative flippase GtrA
MQRVMSTNQSVKAEIEWQREVRRFFRFGIVGFSATLVDFAVLTGLKYFFGWPTLLANLVSYSCGMLDSYLLNRHWVYPEARFQRSHVQLFRFIFINLIGLALNMVLLFGFEVIFNALLNNASYSYIPAKIGATGLVFLWNFFANRLWAFNPNTRTVIKLGKIKGKEVEVYEQTAA